MLILLGGAPRAGKSIVSRECAKRSGVPVLSLDTLMVALHHSVPALGIDITAEPPPIGETMWPIIRAFGEAVLGSDSDYLIEGDMLQPQQVVALRDVGGDQVRSCFLGYQQMAPEAKLADIRDFAGLPNDWLRDRTDEYVLEVAEFGIRYSRQQKDQCDELGLLHFDCSADFAATIDEAVCFLVEGLA